jgi:hypothetical protein
MKLTRVGIILIIIGIACFLTLYIYQGETYLSRTLLYIAFLILLLLGGFLIFVHRTLMAPKQELYDRTSREHFVLNGFVIPITIDNCIIKENNYREEILQDGYSGKYKLFDEIYDPIRNTEFRDIEQSVIIYNYIDESSRIRMISRTFNYDANKLRFYVNRGSVTLHIDKINKNQYMFKFGE